MLVVFPFCSRDLGPAWALAGWIAELGPYPGHKLLVVREQKAAPVALDKMGFTEAKEIVVRDPDNKWPSSPSLMFRSAAKQIQCTTNEAFFWCEPDCVPMREGWLDDLAAEYDAALKAGKHFLGDMIDHRKAGPGFVPHVSGVSVYPKDLVHRAGEIFYAYADVPFDIAAGPAIHSQAKQSELIFHVWQGPNQPGLAPFTSWQDVEQKIFARRPKCALFHSDKTGTLLQLLREHRKEGDEPCQPQSPTLTSLDTPSTVAAIPVGSAEPTSQPESSADMITLKHPDLVYECDRIWVKFDANGNYLGTFEFENGEWVKKKEIAAGSLTTSGNYEISTCPIAEPWKDRAASIAEIKVMAKRLRQFQTNVAYVRFVRSLLADAGVIVLVKKKRRRKKRARGK